MAKKNELEKLIAGLRQCMLVEGTTVEVFRVFEILAEEDGEIDDVLDEYPSIKEEDLRKTFDDLATCFEDICAQMQQSKPQKAKEPRAAIAPDKRNDEVRINIDGAAQGESRARVNRGRFHRLAKLSLLRNQQTYRIDYQQRRRIHRSDRGNEKSARTRLREHFGLLRQPADGQAGQGHLQNKELKT